MQCSICEKMFAASLSICPSCGAMQTQHTQAESSLRLLSIEKISTSDLALEIDDAASPADLVSMSSENDFYGQTGQQIRRGQTTTLLEFPAKKSKDQEWREEIKNRIRQRQEGGSLAAIVAATNNEVKKANKTAASAESSLVINLKPKLAEKQSPKSKDLVAEALKRIERSRQQFENAELVIEESSKTALPNCSDIESSKQSETPNSTLTLVPSRKVLPLIEDDNSKNDEAKPPDLKAERKSVFTVPLSVPTNPAKPKIEAVRESTTDLNELDDENAIAASLKSVRKISAQQALLEYQELSERVSPVQNAERESNDDYAPLGQRFAACLIDIGLCGSSAFAFSHFALGATLTTGWFSTGIAFAGILFLYSTVALMFTGTTLGMALFGMSVVTAEDGDIPTVSQTAIGNIIFLLTLAFGGLPLATIFFSSERRALHDLLSGTMVVKE
ncbi:MAG: RDD family protein [Pyrinomonadaceae bacterium]